MTDASLHRPSRTDRQGSRVLPRVLVVGLDGATYDVLAPLAADGVMPNVAKLLESAALAELRSTQPAITPAAWTTFQTGCDPHEHGIWDFRYLDHDQGQVLLNHSGRIACPTLFHEIAAAGGEVVSLGLPMTWPAPSVPGIIVGGFDSPTPAAALGSCGKFARRLERHDISLDFTTIWRRKPGGFDELYAGVVRTQASFRSQAAAARLADRMVDWRLMFVQFQQLDSLQHRCWHLLGLDDGSGAPAAWRAAARSALRSLDEAVGDLAELAQRRGAALVLLSDHGFGPFVGKISVTELLRGRGLLTPAGEWGRSGFRLARLGWKLRKWFWRRSQRGASSASVRRPIEGLLPIDWRRSVAVAPHGDLAGLVYLNSPQRFDGGPLTTPRLREQAAADVTAAFREARHPQTALPLFTEVFETAQRFQADPLARCWPDIVAIPADGFHTRVKFDADRRLVSPDADLTGTHRREGVLMISAPGVPSGRRVAADLRDVAPTLLRMLGQAPGAAMSGRVLDEMLPAMPAPSPAGESPSLRQARPVDRPGSEHSAAEQQLVEARLRELGYLA